MAGIVLPRVRRNLLLECFTWPMTLAALTDDRESVLMFKSDLDYTVENVNLIVNHSQILKALKYCAKGGEFVPVEAKSLDIIFEERRFLGELGFLKNKPKKAPEPYLSYFTMPPSFFNEL